MEQHSKIIGRYKNVVDPKSRRMGVFRALANTYGLYDWQCSIHETKDRLGQCDPCSHLLSVCGECASSNIPDSYVYNVMLHEIAHALVGPGKGHGEEWVRTAQRIGCTGEARTIVPLPKSFYEWIGTCTQCGEEYPKNNVTKLEMVTLRCNNVSCQNKILKWSKQ